MSDSQQPNTDPQRRLAEPPPADRLPAHVRRALAAASRHERGEGPGLTARDVEALMDLTSWSFNGVPSDDPRFEERLAAWQAAAVRRHEERSAS